MRQTPVVAFDKRVIIFAGAYGSGKTEVAVNFALHLAVTQDLPVSIVDLDIVNPYFRSREAAHELESYGINVIMPHNEKCHADLPIILPEIKGSIERFDGLVVLDVGGDDLGARVLGSLADSFRPGGYEFLMVLNANRPFTSSVDGSVKMMKEIEGSARLRFTGIVSNTHLIEQTTSETVTRGYKIATEVGNQVGIPVVFVSAVTDIAKLLGADEIKVPVLPLSRQMLKPWETRTKVARGPLGRQ